MRTQDRLARALEAHARHKEIHGDLGLRGCAGCVDLGQAGCAGCQGLAGCAGCHLGEMTPTAQWTIGLAAVGLLAGGLWWWQNR
jgi:hypothetical protein